MAYNHVRVRDADAGSRSSPGRILLICFRFGPGCDTGGYRWNAMVRDLTRRGWRFDVITVGSLVSEGGTGRLDSSYHDGAVEIFQVPQDWWGQRLRGRIRAWAQQLPGARSGRGTQDQAAASEEGRNAWLDAGRDQAVAVTELMRDLDWTRRARRVARNLAAHRRYHCVIASSPRHLTQLIGADIAYHTGIPYIPDFRDPWYYGRGADRQRLDPATRALWRYAERRCLRQARLAIDVAEGAQHAVEREVPPELAVPRRFISNGYDYIERVATPDRDCFRVVYTGTVYPFNPVPAVLAACARLRRRHDLAPSQLSIEFVGRMPDIEGLTPVELARHHHLADCFSHRDRLPAGQASALQQQAAVLLAFDSVCINALCIPSKLYHYAQMKGDMLLIGDPAGAMAMQAAKINLAVHRADNGTGLDRALEASFERWRTGTMIERNDPNGQFDSRQQSALMHELLTALDTNGGEDRPPEPRGAT